ncbi:hypothetical protein OIU79_008391 [Salix purpurea]|uniref:Uncharacterized protein n=1 Tax=Salix purpurea TaxID=77065 RepID=A0A9Q0TI91_SALPP|nr:hypothetical protein OIU79_008391 [Salix purpurea]
MQPLYGPQQKKTQYTQLPRYPRYLSYPLPAIPSSFAQNPLIRPLPGSDLLSQQAAEDLRAHLSSRCEVHDLPLPICAVIDFQLRSTEQVFRKLSIPVIGFFIFGASAAAMEWGAWKVRAGDVEPGETHLVPGLPEEMAITYWDLKRKEVGPPSPAGEEARLLGKQKKPALSAMTQEIWVVPFFGQGHLLPSIELCKHIASRNLRTTLIVPSDCASAVPSSISQYPLLEIAELPSSPPPLQQPPGPDPLLPPHGHHNQMAESLEDLISARSLNPVSRKPACVIVDVMMSWNLEVFAKFEQPWSMPCGKPTWMSLKPGEIRLLHGLPEEMALTDSDLKSRPHVPPGGRGGGPPGPGGRGGGPPGLGGPPGPVGGFPRPPGDTGPSKMMGPPKAGGPPPWLEEAKSSIAYMINTCDALEHPFIQYLVDQVKKPVWDIGPLLPELYWKSIGSLLHDHEIRAGRRSNVTEEEVENRHLANALEALNRPFIWVIQPGSGRPGPPPGFSEGGEPSAENEKDDIPLDFDKRMIKKDDIIKGIESLFADEDVKSRAALLGAKFKHGFPASSVKSLDAFRDFIKQKAVV